MGWYLGSQFSYDIELLKQKLESHPKPVSGAIFIVLYVVLTSIFWFGPKDILRVSGALLFGAAVSSIFIWIAEVINSFIMFHLSRSLGREFVESRLKLKKGRMDAVERSRSWLGVFAWRINPLVAIRFTDLAYGLTSIKFPRYLIPASIATIPRIYWLQYILADLGMALFKKPSSVQEYIMQNSFFIRFSMVYFASVVIIWIVAGISKFNRR